VSIDLHVHSTASDGTLAPADLVAEAARLGLTGLAISDHDSVEGLPSAVEAARGTSVVLVPAIELSAVADDGRPLHILGYRVDPTEPRLLARLRVFRQERHERAMRMVAALQEGGYAIDADDVMREAAGGAVGRAHIARALVRSGAVPTMGSAFTRLIGHDRPFFVPKPRVSPLEVLGLIRGARGLAVLAHPGISHVDDLIDGLVADGLRGLEVWHSEHSPEDVARYGALASRLGLLATGGSDYHGPSSSGGGKRLGCVDVPDEALTALLEAPQA
jgi:predicted metal-dependent phosphoesterase TrpH